MAKSAKIYRLPTAEVPTELLEPTIEHFEIEHIELKGAEPVTPAKNDNCQRAHMRVEHLDIKARFIIGVKPKRIHPFTSVFSCQVMNISMAAVCIETTKHLYEDETIVLYFSKHGGDKTEEVAIEGSVVRRAVLSTTIFQYGIQFSNKIPQGGLQSVICRRAIEKKIGHDPTNSS